MRRCGYTVPTMKRCVPVLAIALVLCTCSCSGKSTTRTSIARKPAARPASQGTAQAQGVTQQLGLTIPQGFRISIFASNLTGPRMMALDPSGRLFVTEMDGGRVTILPDTNGDGRADRNVVYASGLNLPSGIAFYGGYLYIAETNRVIRYPFRAGDTTAPRPEVVIPNLPTGGHITRTISFGPDNKLYLAVGSSCNVCIEQNPVRAAISRYNTDGSGRQIIATGLRNAVGMAWNPTTKRLWVTDNGRDFLGDNLPPDTVYVVQDGGFYGWPYAYGNRVPDPEFGSRAPAKVRSTIPPKIAIQAHSAPLGLAFYTGSMFPAEYRGNLFICYHGSWNRSVPTGYKVVRFVVRDGNVVGGQHDFITGWLKGRGVSGRPVDPLVGKYGELYITDDDGGRVYRVTYGR